MLLRGDMDALPMPEDTGLPFASTVEGTMHACGHDTHTAMLAAAARALCARRESLAGTVLFMFQPGEEGWHGARFMLEDGLLESGARRGLRAAHHAQCAGGHLRRQGRAAAGRGRQLIERARQGRPCLAAARRGRSHPRRLRDRDRAAGDGHAAHRRLRSGGADHRADHGGSTNNVIPESANLLGTIRTLSEETRATAHAGIARIAEHVARAHECEARVEIVPGFPVTVCDARAVGVAERAIGSLFGADAWSTMASPIMGAEDFSYVLQRVPGVMVFLGVCPEGQPWKSACPCHSNKMVLNEEMLARGVAAHCAIAERFLTRGFD